MALKWVRNTNILADFEFRINFCGLAAFNWISLPYRLNFRYERGGAGTAPSKLICT